MKTRDQIKVEAVAAALDSLLSIEADLKQSPALIAYHDSQVHFRALKKGLTESLEDYRSKSRA